METKKYKKMTKRILKTWRDVFLHAIYPDCCPFCGKITEGQKRICPSCRRRIEEPAEPLCKRCGKTILHPEGEYCPDCSKKTVFYECGRSLWVHKPPVSDAVYRFKYRGARCYAGIFAREIWERFEWQIYRWEIDVIIPVPIHISRRRERGFNQAELLACGLSEISGIPVDADALIRERKTNAQKNVSGKERKENLRNAFVCRNICRNYYNVLVIDDIYTTGSTVEAVSEVLVKAGIQNVYFVTISIGQGI